jgi:hypothetical protein
MACYGESFTLIFLRNLEGSLTILTLYGNTKFVATNNVGNVRGLL